METGHIGVSMIRDHLRGLPQYELSAPHSIRGWQPGDDQAWIRIHQAADKLTKGNWPQLFQKQFGDGMADLPDRMFFLCGPGSRPIGTATAWYGGREDGGADWGRVHWVAILPEWQGKGLAKPLLAAVMNRLRQSHVRAWLSTSTGRLAAVGLYLKFGFVPEIRNEADRPAWRLVREHLDHPGLAGLDSG